MTTNTEHFKELLGGELNKLESELSTVGRKNPDNQSDWEATEKPNGTDEADELEVADSLEEFENNKGILNQLEIRLNEVKKALSKIDDGHMEFVKFVMNPLKKTDLKQIPLLRHVSHICNIFYFCKVAKATLISRLVPYGSFEDLLSTGNSPKSSNN